MLKLLSLSHVCPLHAQYFTRVNNTSPLLLLRHPPLTRTNSHTFLILSPPSLSPKKMADRNSGTVQLQRQPRPNSAQAAFLRQLHEHAPNSGQLFGFLTLVISSAILLFFTGLTITATVLGLIFFTPLILISSPIWVPVGTVLFIAISGFLSVCGFGMGTVAAMSWIYRYYRGLHPVGSDRVDYARSRIADTASHVKDYAREYGGYLHGKVKDAAPGA